MPRAPCMDHHRLRYALPYCSTQHTSVSIASSRFLRSYTRNCIAWDFFVLFGVFCFYVSAGETGLAHGLAFTCL